MIRMVKTDCKSGIRISNAANPSIRASTLRVFLIVPGLSRTDKTGGWSIC